MTIPPFHEGREKTLCSSRKNLNNKNAMEAEAGEKRERANDKESYKLNYRA